MKLISIPEPELQFAQGTHVCPRAGIARFSVFDSQMQTRRERIHVGAVGNAEGLEKLQRWLSRCSMEIPAKSGARQPNLFAAFPGFGIRTGFHADLLFNSEIERQISRGDLKAAMEVVPWEKRVERAVELFFDEAKFLAQNRTVDVIVCVLPDALYTKVVDDETHAKGEDEQSLGDDEQEVDDVENQDDDEGITELEINFRRLLKARVMALARPIQIIREHSLEHARDQQDEATKAWNFCTALYYKSGQTVPWKMVRDPAKPSVCAIGVSFYQSRDRKTLNTSLAQMFDELGHGLILRGSEVQHDKEDRRPYMTEEQAHDLIARALKEYWDALKTMPARLVVHKSSNFRSCELDGIRSAAKVRNIAAIDFVTVMDSRLRLFRGATYPPYRGTRVELDGRTSLLYTRGSVPYYETYTGKYIPAPLEVRVVESEESAAMICQEILALTKMNWNNTQFDGKYPVTLGCARRVGEIMKYLPAEVEPQVRYSYYM